MSLLATVLDNREGGIERAKGMLVSAHQSGWTGDYLILYFGQKFEELEDFSKKGIVVKQVSSTFFEEDEWFNRTTWNKFYLFGEEYINHRPILYLDVDVLVYDSLSWVESVSSFGAVRSHHTEGVLSNRIHNCTLEECLIPGLDIDLNAPQFNAGVFVIGKKTKPVPMRILKEITRKIRQYCILRDQSVLNFLFHKQWENLPQKYNYSAEVILEQLNSGNLNHDDYLIVHFSGNYYDIFTKEFKRFSDRFNNTEFNNPVKNIKRNINFSGENSVQKVHDSLFSMFRRAWPYMYYNDADFKKRNPNPDIIKAGEQIKVPGWFLAIHS